MAVAAPGGAGGLFCNSNRRHHHHFFFSSHPSPQPSGHLCQPLRIRITYIISSEHTLSPSSASLTCSALRPSSSSSSSSSIRPLLMAAKFGMKSSSEDERESLDGLAGKAARVERLWQQFFWSPSEWWDKRLDKESAEAPDFEHKTSKKALWINDKLSPSWLQEELATLNPQQSSSSASSSSSIECWGEAAIFVHTGQASRTTQSWEEFLSDPSQCWNNCLSFRLVRKQRNPRFSDVRHKTAKKALGINNRFNHPAVHARLAAMVQCQPEISKPETSDRVVRMEQLWLEFFSDPSQWWDNKVFKKSPKHPDFKHRITREGLWIEGRLNPSWVKAKLATMSLGQIQSGVGLRSRVPDPFCSGDKVMKFCKEGRLKEALHMVEFMVRQNKRAPVDAYVVLLKLCGRRKTLVEGKRVHALIILSGFHLHMFLRNTLIDMYAKCGSVLDARKAFDTMPEHNVFSWTAIISAYADHGQGEEAINLFQQMQQTGIGPDKVAFVVVLKACTRISALEQGKQLHSDIIKSGFESDVTIGNSLVNMYAKCGCIEHAHQAFNKMSERDVISWNAMIAGYADNGLGKQALALYERMKQEGVQPNNVTYVVLLKACANIAALEEGKQLHSQIIKTGFESNMIVGNTLVDMYAKCGCIDNARQVFNNMSKRNVVSWSAMIGGYAQNGLGKDALALYEQMKQEGVQPDNITYVILLKTCASITALEQGKQLHSHIIKSGSELDVIMGSALVDMYAKCGCIELAHQVFNKVSERNVVSWSAMIAGYAQQGFGKEALTLLEQMQREGLKPDEVTYVCVLSACSHSGLVNEGCHLFKSMCQDHGVTPTMRHYACMVDLLSRAGCLADAEDFINKMPIQPGVVVWLTLLGAARNHGHVEIGRRAFDCIVKLEPENAAAYVLLSNIYAEAGRMNEVAKIRNE